MYKVAFVGGTERGHDVLQMLLQRKSIQVSYICGMKEDDHETSRYSDDIHKLALEASIPVSIIRKLGADDIDAILSTTPDVILVVGWRTLFDRRLHEFPAFGAWAAHDSLLPQYRGFAPLNWAIINGEQKTGVTLFKVDDGMDTGPVICCEEVIIQSHEAAADIYRKIIKATMNVVAQALDMLNAGTLQFVPQDETLSTYTCPRVPDDGLIDWACPADVIRRLILALSPPYPGAFSFYKGRMFKILSCEIPETPRTYIGMVPGRPVRIYRGKGVEVMTSQGTIMIQNILTEDGDVMTADRLIQSLRTTLGLSTLDLYRMFGRKNL